MPNGDIVSGSSDGVVRVFSASEERWATQEDLQQYENSVASQALPSQVVGDVKKSDLPGPDILSAPGISSLSCFFNVTDGPLSTGKKDGEVKMVTNGDNVEAHQVASTITIAFLLAHWT